MAGKNPTFLGCVSVVSNNNERQKNEFISNIMYLPGCYGQDFVRRVPACLLKAGCAVLYTSNLYFGPDGVRNVLQKLAVQN